jgi:hypothetical protein
MEYAWKDKNARIFVGKPKEENHLGNQGVDGRIICK